MNQVDIISLYILCNEMSDASLALLLYIMHCFQTSLTRRSLNDHAFWVSRLVSIYYTRILLYCSKVSPCCFFQQCWTSHTSMNANVLLKALCILNMTQLASNILPGRCCAFFARQSFASVNWKPVYVWTTSYTPCWCKTVLLFNSNCFQYA